MAKEWFATWFDSPHYHALYNRRNDEEAAGFIAALMQLLQLPTSASVLDLACGKGRHCRTLHCLGYQTTGVDLSPKSIQHAQQYEAPGLHFAVHDMRSVLAVNYFDAVLNLFTSFGYLQTMRENAQVAHAMVAAAKKNAFIVVDFLNAVQIVNIYTQAQHSTEQRDDLTYHITKHITNNRIIKDIEVKQDNQVLGTFQESVQLLMLADFEKLFAHKAQLLHVYGNYALAPYEASTSDRLIMVFQKL